MHRVIKAHLDAFVEKFDLMKIDLSKQFEHFCNYSILASKVASTFDFEDISTSIDDDSIDGVVVIIDEEIVLSSEDVNEILKKERKNIDVELVFVQAKTSEAFDLGDFLKFKDAILRFLNDEKYSVNDQNLKEANIIFGLCVDNITKIRDGLNLTVRFITTGQYSSPKEFERAKNEFNKALIGTGFFSKIDIQFLGKNELAKLWTATYSGVRTQLPIVNSIPLPIMSDIDEAYLIVAKATDVVNKLLIHDNGSLRTQVFEENVRSFLGIENNVNQSISKTLRDKNLSSRFPVLNNGITVVSPKVRVQGTVLHLEDYQIVNGCQTSNILYENREHLNPETIVHLKVVATSNESVFADIVKATNSQSKIEDSQFYSLKPIVKRIEEFFNTYIDTDGCLYFERRDHQFTGKSVKAARIMNLKVVASAVGAMFYMRPDLAGRYAKQMYEVIGKDIFDEKNKEIIFYCASLALYQLHNLVSTAQIPQNMRLYKWHILALLRASLMSPEVPKMGARSVEKECQKIIDLLLSKNKEKIIQVYNKPVEIIQSFGSISRDRLKRQAVLKEMLQKL